MCASKSLLCMSLVIAASLPAAVSQTAELSTTRSAPAAATSATVVPMLVRYDGVALHAASAANMTFLIYNDEKGGEPLWIETQNVATDAAGKYEVYLGSTYTAGLPPALFGTGEARWLEVQIAGEAPGPRTLLTSVPYALKAADAATLGGLPASAFALAGAPAAVTGASSNTITSDGVSNVTTTGGTNFYLPKFNAATTVIDSQIYDNGTSVGIGDTPNPSAKLDVNGAMIMRGNMQVTRTGNATTSKGYPSYGFQFYSNVYNSSTKANDNPYFQLQSEPTGNNTASPSATFNLLFSNNGSAAAETGFSINPTGTVNFASGQTFPGTGTITGITTTSPLTGNGTNGSVALALNTRELEATLNGNYAQLGASNTFSQNQLINAELFAATVSATDLIAASVVAAPYATPYPADYALESYSRNASSAQMGMVSAGTDAAIAVNNTASGGREYWIDSGSSGAGIGAGNFAVYDKTAGATRMVVTSNGLVGINTLTPGAQLQVVSDPDLPGLVVDAVQGIGSFSSPYSSSGISGFGANTDDSSGSMGGNGGVFFGGDADTSEDAGAGLYAQGGRAICCNSYTYAGVFYDDIEVNGNTISSVASTKIDHPTDPANKYLVHASVQSSEMMNMYTGNVTTDGSGHATVALPAWFEAENSDFRYQLTVVGQQAQAWVAKKVGGGEFQIATSPANVEVSWQITAVRQDAYARAHPLVVEEAKPAREVGFYQHPELYGQPATKQTEWGRNPRMMQRMEAQHARAKAHPRQPAAPRPPIPSNMSGAVMQSSLTGAAPK